ncbi:uncharacterized protein B0T15DRAFT_83260 [Chaetomium strumarium]|uniref:Uncharacterized protein n=1 Tax=Chaetomium strumarium TaxID=1170767 RepID=A0AAJ0H512_9PEZI|nr:hypothetical protein B0T15DRAFT_83260 [Chaetomium strumarium]
MTTQDPGQGDPLEKFFPSLPILNARTELDQVLLPCIHDKVVDFLKEVMHHMHVPNSSMDASFRRFDLMDEDCKLFLQHVSDAVGHGVERPHLLVSAIAHLAVKASIRTDDHSAKAKYLRHFRWVAMGKKDEESPYEKQQTANEVDHAHLPRAQMPGSVRAAEAPTQSWLRALDVLFGPLETRPSSRLTAAKPARYRIGSNTGSPATAFGDSTAQHRRSRRSLLSFSSLQLTLIGNLSRSARRTT